MNRRLCMVENWAQALADVTTLRTRSESLSVMLRDVAQILIDTGRPPSAQVIDELRNHRAAFDALISQFPMAQRNSTDENSSETAVSLAEIEEELNSHSVIQSSLERLEQVSRIRHIEQEEFAPLQRCLIDGSKLREELLSAPANRARIAAERFLVDEGPLNAIVTLVTGGAELSDDSWTVLLDSVSATYGREISTALARGKLILRSGMRT